MSFFGYWEPLKRKRKKSVLNFLVRYDQDDPIFKRFIGRFSKESHLAFGERNYFLSDESNLVIEGRRWPRPKAKPKKGPRKSRLATLPVDNTEYVYFIQAGRTQAFKIGKSNDPQGRLDSLQTANPHKLKLVHTFKADNASTAEEELHRLLHSQRMAGEWFKVSKIQQQVIVSIQRFEQGQFWIDSDGVEPDELFVLDERDTP